MKQQSLVLIKPDGIKRNLIGEIIKRFEERGLVVADLVMLRASRGIIDKHYPLNDRNYVLTLGHVEIKGKSKQELEVIYNRNYKIIQNLQDYILSGTIVKMIIEGENAVEIVREIVGKTDPVKSAKGSIRGDLGVDSFETSDKEGRAVYNLVHASGTSEEAKVEIKLWFGK